MTRVHDLFVFKKTPEIENDAVNPNQVPRLSQVQQLSTINRLNKELLLVSEQLDSVNDALSQAGLLYLINQPVSGDNVVLNVIGGTSRTYQFGTGGDVTVTIGADVNESMLNLANAISGDTDGNAFWDAVVNDDLDAVNGRVVVVYRADNSAQDSYNDVIYGTFTTQADFQIIDYNGEYDYRKVTNETASTSEPASKTFGIGRATANLLPNESHTVKSLDDRQYIWDDDSTNWQIFNGAATASQTGLARAAEGTFSISSPTLTYTMTHSFNIGTANNQKMLNVQFYNITQDEPVFIGLSNHGANSVDATFPDTGSLPADADVIAWTIQAYNP